MLDFGGPFVNHFFQMGFISPFFIKQSLVRKRAANSSFNVRNIEWFRNVIKRAGTQGFDSVIDCLPATHHYYNRVRMLFENGGNEFQPADPAHVYVTNNQIEAV